MEDRDNFWKDDTPREHVLGFYNTMKPLHEALSRQWYLNLAQIRGRQWLFYDGDGSDLKQLSGPRWHVQATFNKLLPMAIAQKQSLILVNPTITTKPANTASEKDKHNAETARALLKATWKGKDFQKALKRMISWMVPCTAGYLTAVWDSEEGDPLEPGLGTGDLVFGAPGPFEIVPDFAADWFDELPRFVRFKPRSIGYIERKYGKKVQPDGLNTNAIFQMKAQALTFMGKADLVPALKDHAIVYEMFELPSVKYPSGFHHICTAAEDLIEPKDLDPYYYTGPNGNKKYFLPLASAQMIEIIGSLLGTNCVEQAIPLQAYYNQGKSRVLEEIKRLGRVKIVAEKGSIPRGAMIDDPAEIIVEVNEGASFPPFALKPPEMPQYYLEFVRNLPLEIQDIFGLHDASMGVLPRRATSAKAIGFLVGKDADRAQDPKEGIDAAVEDIMRKALNIMANCYDEARVKDVIGEDGQITQRTLKGEELRAVDVTIIRDTSLPKSAAERMDLATAILEKNPSVKQVELVFAIMQADSIEDVKNIIAGYSEGEETYARMENFDMAKMIPRPVIAGENHQLHMKIHDELIKKPEADPRARTLAFQHKQMHMEQQGLEASQPPAAPGAAPAPAPAPAAPPPEL